MRYATLLLLLVGCHGTDLRVGTGHAFADGESSASASGKHGTRANVDSEAADTTSVWMELGFQLTPQTVIVQHADEHVLEPLYPPVMPPVVVDQPCVATPVVAHVQEKPPPQVVGREPVIEDPDIDWEEVVVAVALGLIPLLFGGRYAVRKVRSRRAQKEDSMAKKKPRKPKPRYKEGP